MSAQLSATPAQPLAPASPPAKLWTPRAVGYITFFLGFPVGLVMAARNWMRMGLTNKAITHLVAGGVGILAFVILYLILPGSVGSVLGLAVNIGVLLYLQAQTRRDIAALIAANHAVQNAHWVGGCLIGLVMIVLWIPLVLVVGLFLELLGVPIPE